MSEKNRPLGMSSPEEEIRAMEREQRERADLQGRLEGGNPILDKLDDLVREVKAMRGELAAIRSALDKPAPTR